MERSKQNASRSAGFLRLIIDLSNVKLMAYLGDVLFIFSRFQQKLQSNTLAIVSLAGHVQNLSSQIADLENNSLPGGFETILDSSIKFENGKAYLKEIELPTNAMASRGRRRPFKTIRNSILLSLQEVLKSRFNTEIDLIKNIKPFVEFGTKADLKNIHNLIGCDLDLSSIHLQSYELCQSEVAGSRTCL